MLPTVADMDLQHENNPAAGSSAAADAVTGPLSERESLRKDMSYSPASEAETRQKQAEKVSETLDPEIDADDVRVAPGTGGPDDPGDVDVDPGDVHLPTASSEKT